MIPIVSDEMPIIVKVRYIAYRSCYIFAWKYNVKKFIPCPQPVTGKQILL